MQELSPRHMMQLSFSPLRSAVTPWKKSRLPIACTASLSSLATFDRNSSKTW